MTLPVRCTKDFGTRTVEKGILLITLLLLFGLILAVRMTDRTVILHLDDNRMELNTKAITVGDVLEENGLYVRSCDLLSPGMDERITRDMVITLQRAIPVVIHADEQIRLVYTTAENINELLAQEQIELNGQDRLQPAAGSPLKSGQTVRIIRVARELVREEEPIPFETVSRKNSALTMGQRKVEVEGAEGVLQRTYEVVMADNCEESRELVEEKRVREPVARVIAVGTKPAPVVTVSSRGEVVGRIYEGKASWISNNLHGHTTAYGAVYDKDEFTCAFPDKALQGRTLRVTYLKTDRSVDVVVNDYGPHVKGRIIDLSAAAAREIGLSGVGSVTVEVLK